MPTRSSYSAYPPSFRVARALYRSLEGEFSRQCAEHYNTGVELQCVDAPAKNDPEVTLRVNCRGLAKMRARVTVARTGGNVYDVHCIVEEGASRRFSHSVPTPSGAEQVRAPQLGEKVAAWLRTELERRIGRRLLRRPTGRATRQHPPRLS